LEHDEFGDKAKRIVQRRPEKRHPCRRPCLSEQAGYYDRRKRDGGVAPPFLGAQNANRDSG
jgi:hypothetical protein